MSSRAARLELPPAARTLPLAGGLLALGTIAAGALIRHVHGGLGTATPPFVMGWRPRFDLPWAPIAFVVAAGAATLGPRLAAAGAHPPRRAAWPVALTALALLLALALNAAPTGSHGWSEVFDTGPHGSFEAKNEYLPGLPALRYGPRFFLDRFAELVPSQTVNVAGHPPGLLLLFHGLRLTTAARLAAFCIGAAALVPAGTWGLARAVGLDGTRARAAGLLAALSPVLLLFGTTSADAVLAAAGVAAAALLVAPDRRLRGAGCVALAVAAFASWALLAVAAWAVVVVALRDGPRPALLLAAGCGAAVVALDAALALGTGYDAIGTLRATQRYYALSVSTQRPYAFWVVGSPTAFATLLGPPIAGLALVAVARRRPAALALAAVIGVAALAGFTKAETERIWLPFVPLACVAAAEVLPAARLRLVAALLVAEALGVALLFGTVW